MTRHDLVLAVCYIVLQCCLQCIILLQYLYCNEGGIDKILRALLQCLSLPIVERRALDRS